MKTFRFFVVFIIAIVNIGLTSCSKDDDDTKSNETVTITNKSSQKLTDLTFVCYDSDNDDEEGDDQFLKDLEIGESKKFKLTGKSDTWFLVCHIGAKSYESPDYKSKSLTITDKELEKWWH